MTRSTGHLLAATALSLLLAAPAAAQNLGGDPNRDEGSGAVAEKGYTARDVMDAMREGVDDPAAAFQGDTGDLEVVVVRLSELEGTEEEMAELDAVLTDSAREFVEYHRQVVENEAVSRGIDEVGYTAEDVVALWQGDEQIVLIVDDGGSD
ncbi:hypothetical protein [Histidinibacterium lentulum]|uniref:Uncharacterized protein n=1 Tax=Histidinibacterium lentulum TaxID=2480588 RepID=A0A3N2R778_9RHOB|nr:hypothetical protein [Histidinibacterium lentulum]ROU03342.1 hypothetical protein EAT49_03270 [Histidinibacterium lentulum]